MARRRDGVAARRMAPRAARCVAARVAPRRVAPRRMAVGLVVPALVAACATGRPGPPGAPGTPGPEGAPQVPGVPERARPGGASPGFDTRSFPGDSAMATWKASSPYEWVGYYLPAPCYTGSSWVGRRAALEAAKWGLAVVFIGEQDWSAATGARASAADTAVVPADTAATPTDTARSAAAGAAVAAPPPAAGPQCTRANLSAERGAADATRADSTAAAEGFQPGTTIFLDVERVDSVSAPLAAYVRGWIAGLLARGRFTPGIYAHALNADTLRSIQLAALPRHSNADEAPFWVARPEAFTIDFGPRQSGFEYATVWQGAVDRFETWGGVTLRVDVNVAATPAPSAPPK